MQIDDAAMVIAEFTRSETESLTDIEEMLQGHVFHVTKRAYWPAINESGALLPNPSGVLPTTFGTSKNSYFRKRGCVCLFDYRQAPTEELQVYRRRCHPMQAAKPGEEGISILLFESSLYERVISWEGWKKEEAFSEMVVPYAEAGHLGPIPLSEVSTVIHLRKTKVTNRL